MTIVDSLHQCYVGRGTQSQLSCTFTAVLKLAPLPSRGDRLSTLTRETCFIPNFRRYFKQKHKKSGTDSNSKTQCTSSVDLPKKLALFTRYWRNKEMARITIQNFHLVRIGERWNICSYILLWFCRTPVYLRWLRSNLYRLIICSSFEWMWLRLWRADFLLPAK